MNPLDSFTVQELKFMADSDHAQAGDVSALAKIALAAKQAEPNFKEWLSSRTDTIESDCGCVSTETFYHWLKVAYEANHTGIPDGWVMVPKELTDEMAEAANEYHEGEAYLPYSLYRTMIAAAPKPDHIEQTLEMVADASLINEDNNEWVKCSDRMPKEHGSYLTWDGRYIVVASMLFNNFFPAMMTQGNVTHWMPLPAAPKPE